VKHFYVIGDSMTGAKLTALKKEGGVGWAEYIDPLFNSEKCQWHNKSIIGWAIRDFFNRVNCYPDETYLEKFIFNKMEFDKDNTLFACFGTLEGAKLNIEETGWDPRGYSGPRGSIPGIGNESKVIFDEKYQVEYIVYTFGEYLRRLIKLCEKYKIDLYLLTPPARNTWKNGKHYRSGSLKYRDWMIQIANKYDIKYIDNNEVFSQYLNSLGEEKTKELFAIHKFVLADREHTSPKGAQKYAELVRDELIRKYPETFKALI